MGDAEALDSMLHQVKSKMAFRYDVMKLEDDDEDPNDVHSTLWNNHKTATSSRQPGEHAVSSKMSSKVGGQVANEKSVKALLAQQRRESVKQATRDATASMGGMTMLRKSMSEYGVEER